MSDDWDWDNGDDETSFRTPCLFCKEFNDLDKVLEHLQTAHQLGFQTLFQICDGNQYNYFKLINYIRKHKLSPQSVLSFDKSFFNTEESMKYIKPTIDNDGFLMIDAEWCDPETGMANVEHPMDELEDDVVKEMMAIKKEDDMRMEEDEKIDDESDD
ncbi:hypothetical protein EIN_411170 [Entamoeba invadens IP1]|uniref:type I protein arginine methyltransferase n=1 Tax=Entamoeba invadens IP1 TaxID=370355 RepID=A0A0A1U715_ENTIV|nr:hypothetical protein EIN_411170 [Entamoeba invadens IP1]ELP87764.1 hypothetical protein EIN_411170 [Entamoeba invadens IP1]|eukprot:XP_004254535.1 hypothetical protein EIN_411170 [Entamoeba invadens IP1]